MIWGVQKVINYNKIKEVTQGENENPALLLAKLTENFKNFTLGRSKKYGRKSPVSPFLHNPGIRKKLQNLGKGAETPISDLVRRQIGCF